MKTQTQKQPAVKTKSSNSTIDLLDLFKNRMVGYKAGDTVKEMVHFDDRLNEIEVKIKKTNRNGFTGEILSSILKDWNGNKIESEIVDYTGFVGNTFNFKLLYKPDHSKSELATI